MKRSIHRFLALAALPAFLVAAPSRAEEAGRLELALVGGAGFGTRVLTSSTQETRIGNSGLLGLRAGWAFSPSFRLEAAWSRVATDFLSRDPSTGGSYGKSGSVTTDAYELNALYDYGGSSTRGYLGIGAGGMTISPTVASLSDSETRFAFTAAVGVRQLLGEHLTLRAEGRWRWRDGKTRVGTTVCDGECKPFTTNWYSSAELTAAVGWRF